MKIVLWCASIALVLAGCEGWPLTTIPYNPPTIAPSRTPSIQTATPIILSPVPNTASAETPANTPITASLTATLMVATPSETLMPTASASHGQVSAAILGCDTGIDILHGMGEVTNAYVTIANATSAEIPNMCATLNALDEARPHPDKTRCLPSLAAGYQVAFKLTVDTTYKANSPIQVNIMSGENLLLRLGEASCRAIGLLPPDIDGLGTPQVIPAGATPFQP